ncbi:MAG TPA: ribosome rescue protein RqcH [Methanothrix sp.]|nr:ribosome rescue protein RqcH [Methanothrix sp.]HQJ79756.1 ribosome rescue protein RqcH [Methanothrix sp.]
MKKAMSNVDVAAMVSELSDRILGGFVGKAYQQSSDRIWLSVASPAEGRLDLLLAAGRRVNITRADRPASKTPPQFPTMLRSRLTGGRIVEIRQHDFDRVLEIEVERSGTRHILVVELFPKGSMLLLDSSRTILSLLKKTVYRGSKMAAGEKYLYHPGQLDPRRISIPDLSAWLSAAGQDLVRSLVRGLNMSGTYAEEVCLVAGVDKNKPAIDLDDGETQRVHQALQEVFSDQSLDPHIVLDAGVPVDVLPRPLKIYQGLEARRYPTLSEAMDTFFVEAEPKEAKKDPLEKRIELQRAAVADFEAQESQLMAKGERIYQIYGSVEAILQVVAGAREKGFSYNQIWERISSSGLPQAKTILSLNGQGKMRVSLEETELEIDAGLTVAQNAQKYYERAKELSRKAAGAREAMAITEQLRAGASAPRKARPAAAVRRRKPKWYERFRWFITSDGFLVLGGRDAESNEEIYARYLERRDLAMHTDAPGAPLTVIKTEGKAVPESSLQEAAAFAVSYSSSWKAGLASADCYLIRGDQVSQTAEPGQFLKKGAFVIRGERTYFKNTTLGLALGISGGILIGGPVTAVKPRADPLVEIEPGEFNADDLAKRIYRLFSEKVEDRAFLKSVASVDQIVQFLPPGGSRIKGGAS